MSAGPGGNRIRPHASARRLGMVGLVLLGALVVVAVAAPWLSPFDPTARVGLPFDRPSGTHLLGTDDVGHDLLSVLLHGARATLVVGLAAAAVATVVGATVGLVAGSARGAVDTIAMRAVDVVLSLPFLPLMIVVGVFLGPGLRTQVLVIAAVMWAAPARELRSQVLSIREREHVLSAWSMGASLPHVVARHVAPVVLPLVVPQFVLAARRTILFEAALSFLGLGAGSTPSWGAMLSTAQARSAFLTDSWAWWVVPPGLGIALAVVSFAFIGYGIEERARPHLVDPTPARPPVGSRVVVTSSASPPPGPDPEPAGSGLLDIRDLTVSWSTSHGSMAAVDGVSLSLEPGEVVGLVGESGAGKSTLARAAAGLLPASAMVESGRVVFGGTDLLRLPPSALRRLHGKRIAWVPQDAGNALNPVHRIGAQVAEAITTHHDLRPDVVDDRVRDLLARVGVDPGRLRAWPHELSGGQRQRVVLAMALANEPALLVADEPTNGLDVVLQANLVTLLRSLCSESDAALLIVTHDLPLVLAVADRLVVMQAGRVVEEGRADDVVRSPRHEHTRRLVTSIPRLGMARDRVGG